MKVNLSTIYFTTAFLSLILLIFCHRFVRHKRFWFLMLFSSVLVVNTGYTFLSFSTNLEMALMANRVSYLGSVFLPLSMLMIILNATNISYSKKLPGILLGIAFLIFLIAASPGILPIYYKDVSFTIIEGTAVLVKVYGPLHPIYLFYLLGYFVSMVIIIIHASKNKFIANASHAIVLATAVFVNIGVWFIEQITSLEFEMLSISYIISEMFLLGIHLVSTENQRLHEIITQAESSPEFPEKAIANEMLENPLETDAVTPAQLKAFIEGIQLLTPTERTIYDAYIARVTTKELLANMNIKENTLKYHNKNIYSKLCVSSRKELLEMYKHINAKKGTLF